ncbi:MAG: DUF6940 family protein [Dongiaceae bacterium]
MQRDDRALRVGDAVELWQQDRAFRAFFMAQLSAAPFAAYFWECPPVTTATVTRPFEFVLVDSPQLAGMPPDTRAFSSHFNDGEQGDAVATFWSLGRDALLVAPSPRAAPAAYAHLAAFGRGAPLEQQHALWRAVGDAVAARLSARPLWLSTSGLGVAWLHVRLDSRPKYYSHQPYRQSGS